MPKRPFSMGHSFQAVGIFGCALQTVCAIPLVSRIQKGIVYSNRDNRALLEKMVYLINYLGMTEKFYFLADAYYAGKPII